MDVRWPRVDGVTLHDGTPRYAPARRPSSSALNRPTHHLIATILARGTVFGLVLVERGHPQHHSASCSNSRRSRLRGNDTVAKLPRLPRETRRLSCGRVDDVEATRHRVDAIAATTSSSSSFFHAESVPFPGKIGLPRYISPITHPTAHKSTAVPRRVCSRFKSSGARYHRVATL